MSDIGSYTSPKDKYLQSHNTDMKSIEIDEKEKRHLSTNERHNDNLSIPEPKVTVAIEEGYATLRYERRLSHPREVVWRAITDPNELAGWMNTKAVIDGRNGGTIDFVNIVSGFHTEGRILVWDPQCVFEHEWHIAPNPSLPDGEPQAIIHWELEKDGDSGTLLTLNHSHLTRSTSRNFAPGWHAYLDRLEASLNNEVLPDWTQRFGAVKKLYPS
jgi:uncharacterized protein YndB with AHSA1/START domain